MSVTNETCIENNKRLWAALNAVCVDINDIYLVNTNTRTASAVRQEKTVNGLDDMLIKDLDYTVAVESYITGNVFQKDQDGLRNFMDFSNICARLKNDESVSFFYRVFRDGHLQYFRLKCIRLGTPNNFDSFVCAFMREDFESSQAQMVRTLETDDITGIYTKPAFFHHATELMDKNPGKKYDLIITDVENFKLINNIYGHVNGDMLLKYLADAYKNAARNGVCGRYGADQFVVLSEAMSDDEMDTLRQFANNIRANAPLPYVIVRYGIYRNVDRTLDIADMCDKSMLAIRGKKNYREDPISIYDYNIVKKHFRSQMLESGFERAINQQEFKVWCQPKYNAYTKSITSAEALVRWPHPDGIFLSPGDFIPVFEADGLIVQLDLFVFKFICQKQKELLDAGLNPVPISINLSRATLFSPDCVTKYSKITEEIGVPKNLVQIELTESATVDNFQINTLVKELKQAGFSLHLDDFGSGFSSLSALATLPFNVLKIDKSLIDNIGDKRGDELLRHTVEISHFYEMEVVAEGVEENYQYNFLKKLGCDTIQGFLFSRPVTFDTFVEMLTSQPKGISSVMDSNIMAEAESVGSMRITNDTKMLYLSSLAGIYMTMHVINLKEDTVVEFATTTNVKEYVNRVHNTAGQMAAAMSATVADDYVDAVLEFTDLSTIAERLKGKRTISAEFVGKHFGWFQARFITVTTNEADEPEIVIYTTRVLESDRKKEDKTIDKCRTDELTGVFNRNAFEEDMKSLWKPTENNKADFCNLAVMSVDVNGLKAANDMAGHAAGDELLWAVADNLNTVLGEDSRIYRMKSDEFIAVFHGSPSHIEKIRSDYLARESNWIGNGIRSLSTSFGIASVHEFPDMSLEELINEADRRRLKYKSVRKN